MSLAHSRASWRASGAALAISRTIVRIIVTGLILSPIVYLAAVSIVRSGPLLSAYGELARPEVGPILGRTIALALASTLLAAVLGGVAGLVFEARKFPARRLLGAVSVAPLVLPPFLHVAVWERLAAPGGLLAAAIPFAADGKGFPIRNLPVAAWILGSSLSPVFFFLARQGLRAVPDELVDAARLTRGSVAVWTRVILPLVAPPMAAGAGVVLTMSLLSYEVPRLLDVTTYSVLVNLNYGALDDPGRAFAAAVPLFAVSAAGLIGAEAWADRRGFSIAGRERRDRCDPCMRPGVTAWCVTGIYWSLTIFLPAVVLVSLVGRPIVLARAWLTDWEKILSGCGMAVAAGIGAAIAAGALLLPPRRQRLLGILPLGLPLALPGALLGFAGIHLAATGPFAWWVDGPGLLWLAHVVRFTPIAVFILRAQLRAVPQDERDAAALGPRGTARWLDAWIPLAAPGLTAGALAAALFSSTELSATILLAAPGAEPVIVRMYNLLHYGPERDALAALCMFQVAGAIAAAAAIGCIGAFLARRR